MMKIQSLLNPLSADHRLGREVSLPLAPTPEPKRQKVSKVAAVFIKGKVKGEVRYPPHEAGDDEELAAEHRKYQIYPPGHIREYPRHIPYNSEKKSFLSKTGREAFEVFQYTFKVPGDDHEYVVMWDYNIGLTRITPFFKCCKYSKTTPARVLNINTGLRDISHSITGGALSAQGYWMPFEAAKAVAATFCYNIRHALTPVFGPDFIHICTQPSDPAFASFKIDRAIVQRSTAQTNDWRQLYSTLNSADGGHSRSTTVSPLGTPRLPAAAPNTPLTPQLAYSYAPWGPKALRPRGATHSSRAADVESGYGTDTDQSDKYRFSPQVSPTTQAVHWTSVNCAPHAPAATPREASEAVCSPTPWLSSVPRSFAPDTTTCAKRRISAVEDDYEDDTVSDAGSEERASLEEPESPERLRSREARAAMMLLRLCDADGTQDTGHRDKRSRRAST